MLRLGRMEATGGFLLLCAMLYYFDNEGFLLLAALAAALHELGHLAAIYALGGRVAKLRLSVTGAEMTLSAVRPLEPPGQLLAALAGPTVNLALAMLSARLASQMGEEWYLFAGLNLSLAVFNLLPAEQLDGGRAIYWLTALLWSPQLARRVSSVLSKLTAVALLLGGSVLFWLTETNFTFFVTSFWLATSIFLSRKRK